jgi:hypothetical protein
MTGAHAGPTIMAHGVAGRQDLPIPFGYAVTGAAVAVAASFLALVVLWREPRLDGERAGWTIPAGLQRFLDAGATRVVIRAVGLVLLGYVLLGAVFGKDDELNPTAGVVYVLFWVGLVVLAVVAGPAGWRMLNPIRTLHLLIAKAAGSDPREGLRALPAGVGWWPGALSLLSFVWLELAVPHRDELPVLRTYFAVYAGVHLVAATVFGSRWLDRGDGFEAYVQMFGRLSPFGRRPADGRLVLRNPLQGLDAIRAEPGLAALVCVMLGSTAFDGLSRTTHWLSFTADAPVGLLTTFSSGLAVVIAAVFCAYLLATRLAGRLGESTRELPGLFAHSIVPIAFGYVIAHYWSFLVINGQLTLIQLSDPLGRGDNWLGTAGRGVDMTLVTPSFVAVLQVVAVVTGHVVGVFAAHDRAVRLFPRRHATLGQLPLLVLMVGYTVFGLFVLFST